MIAHRAVVLGAASATALLAATALIRQRSLSRDWYGFHIGISRTELKDAYWLSPTAVPFDEALLRRAAPPWTQASLSVSRRSGKVVSIHLEDIGAPDVECDVAPCPIEPREKSIQQIRSDSAELRRALIARLGPPSIVQAYGQIDAGSLRWNNESEPASEAASVRCGTSSNSLTTLPTDLRSVEFRFSDNNVSLDLVGRDAVEESRLFRAPAVSPPPVVAPPAPPCPKR